MDTNNILKEIDRGIMGKPKETDYDKDKFISIINKMKDSNFQLFCKHIRRPEYFWKENETYDYIDIYQDGKTDDYFVSQEEIDIREGSLTRDEAIQNIIDDWNAKPIL